MCLRWQKVRIADIMDEEKENDVENALTEDAIIDEPENLEEQPPAQDSEVPESSAGSSEQAHEALSKEYYSQADKDSYYNSYEYLHKVTRTDKFGPIVKQMAGSPGGIIDMGCGTGLWTKMLSEIGKVIGIDFSEPRIEIARERNPEAEYIVGDLKKMPEFLANPVNMFFSCCSLYCLTAESQRAIFSDCFRLLAPGGKLIMIEPNKSNIFREKSELKYPFDKKELKNVLESLGFGNVKISNCNFMPRTLLMKRGIFYSMMIPFEKLLEFFQLPWSGSLLIYAEKPFPEISQAVTSQ